MSLGRLRKLRALSVELSNLRELPDFPGFPLLREFRAGQNHLRRLPSWVGRSPLEVLKLGRNCLEALPTNTTGWSNLRTIELDHNQLTRLPDAVGSAQVLSAADNQLTALPNLPFKRLLVLDVSRNQLLVLPSLDTADSLETLNASSNNLNGCPPLPQHLEILDLSYNHLKTAPPAGPPDSFLTGIDQLLEPLAPIYWRDHKSGGNLIELTAIAVADAAVARNPAEVFRIHIDGLKGAEVGVVRREFRARSLTTRRIGGGREDNSPALRLADALAGFLGDLKNAKPYAPAHWARLQKHFISL